MSRDLKPQITSILDSIYPHASAALTDDPTQSLSRASLSKAHRDLLESLSSPPDLPPVSWKRSKTRRLHLITLGIPVNLDEMAESTAAPLSTLVLPSIRTTNLTNGSRASSPAPMSAPAGSSLGKTLRAGQGASSANNSRSSLALPSAPKIDRSKASKLLALDQSSLALLPLSEVLELRAEMEDLLNQAGHALTYGLEQRERLKNDAETYDRLIQVSSVPVGYVFISHIVHRTGLGQHGSEAETGLFGNKQGLWTEEVRLYSKSEQFRKQRTATLASSTIVVGQEGAKPESSEQVMSRALEIYIACYVAHPNIALSLASFLLICLYDPSCLYASDSPMQVERKTYLDLSVLAFASSACFQKRYRW